MTTVKEMMAAANAAVPKITPDEAWSLMVGKRNLRRRRKPRQRGSDPD
jgi:hypothetical protein